MGSFRLEEVEADDETSAYRINPPERGGSQQRHVAMQLSSLHQHLTVQPSGQVIGPSHIPG
jgi:hypothetical protein